MGKKMGQQWPLAAAVRARVAIALRLVRDDDGDFSFECELLAEDDGLGLSDEEVLWLARWEGVCRRWIEEKGPGYLAFVRPILDGEATPTAAELERTPGLLNEVPPEVPV